MDQPTRSIAVNSFVVSDEPVQSVHPHPPVTALPPARLDASVWQQLLGAPLSPNELATLNALAAIENVEPGKTLFDAGNPAPALVLLLDGDASLGQHDAKGRFQAERNVHGPDWLDAVAAWLGQPHAMAAKATNAVRIARLNAAALRARMERDPALSQHVADGFATQLRTLMEAHRDLVYKSAPARLASWLYRQCWQDSRGLPAGAIHLHHRKRDMASELAVTPETLSRLMARFSRNGVIAVNGYTVQVLDHEALERLAGIRRGHAGAQAAKSE